MSVGRGNGGVEESDRRDEEMPEDLLLSVSEFTEGNRKGEAVRGKGEKQEKDIK